MNKNVLLLLMYTLLESTTNVTVSATTTFSSSEAPFPGPQHGYPAWMTIINTLDELPKENYYLLAKSADDQEGLLCQEGFKSDVSAVTAKCYVVPKQLWPESSTSSYSWCDVHVFGNFCKIEWNPLGQFNIGSEQDISRYMNESRDLLKKVYIAFMNLDPRLY
ncbi:unnamed protein product [Meganyctiphanes norvegica]|uniref:Uncharacterized protein n=1 Tax=Meganyctiphanes norvegica TaxID=48144 RepID=A0AAV2QM91_MEGNR